VSRVLGIRVSRNDANVLASVGLEAMWPASAVVAEKVGTGLVISYCVVPEGGRRERRERIALGDV